MARLRVMDFKKNSAQKGALQKYEEFMSYARRTSPNSYVGGVPAKVIGKREVDPQYKLGSWGWLD